MPRQKLPGQQLYSDAAKTAMVSLIQSESAKGVKIDAACALVVKKVPEFKKSTPDAVKNLYYYYKAKLEGKPRGKRKDAAPVSDTTKKLIEPIQSAVASEESPKELAEAGLEAVKLLRLANEKKLINPDYIDEIERRLRRGLTT